VNTAPDQLQAERDARTPRPDAPGSPRRTWDWFGAVFGVIVLVGASVIYAVNRPGPVAESAEPAAEEIAGAAEAPAEPALDDGAEAIAAGSADETLAVLLGVYIVDSFGFHDLEEAYAEATEIGERDAGQVAKVLTAVDALAWPDDLADVFGAFRADVDGLHAALEAGDLEGVRHGLEGVHGSQHDLSSSAYAWLAGEPVEAHGAEPEDDAGEPVAADDAVEVIEVEMVDFGYEPSSLELQAGVPVVLRFTNTGKLVHEAMVGDAHMQEEFAAAGDHGDGHDDGDDDGHHGGLMAVTVQPGETADLEVVIDEAGEWFVACHLVGHLEQGQIATIDVSA
jgi:uncharacterized cupredoxin-like copper-binding protein